MARFEKNCPPGPGRPKGCRNKATLLLEALGSERLEKVCNVLFDKAESGSVPAAQFLIARLVPRPRGRPVEIELPPVETAAGLVQANAAVVATMAAGGITPEEADSVGRVLATQARAIELHELETRVRAIEKKSDRPDQDQPAPPRPKSPNELLLEESMRSPPPHELLDRADKP